MARFDAQRRGHIWHHVKRGPTEIGYAYFRARRRRKGGGVELSESDRLALSGAFDIRPNDLERTRATVANQLAEAPEIRTIQWFLPHFSHAYFGGVHTILRFADRFATERGVENRFCIYDAPSHGPVPVLAAKIAAAFPGLEGCEVTTARTHKDARAFAHLRECDAAIATLWTSAFHLLRFHRTKAKFYFVQDDESAFYPAGSASALVEETYRFGIPGIVNTPGLAEVYGSYGSAASSFVPAVDTTRFHPPERRDPDAPIKVFFYGRPSTPRNAFGLGLASLMAVKSRLGDRVEIIAAGEPWRPADYGVEGRITSLGLLGSLDELAELYRSCDVGLVFMLTKHPSYQPFEWMASGMATVSNRNPHTAWMLRDGENSLVAPAAPTPVADAICRLVSDRELRERLTTQALVDVRAIHWHEQIDGAWRAMTGG